MLGKMLQNIFTKKIFMIETIEFIWGETDGKRHVAKVDYVITFECKNVVIM